MGWPIRGIPTTRNTLDGAEYVSGQLAAGGAGSTFKTLLSDIAHFVKKFFAEDVVRTNITGAQLHDLMASRQDAGGGMVRVAKNVQVATTTTIQVPYDVHLVMDPGAEIVINADVDGVDLRGSNPTQSPGSGSKLTGGRIRVAHIGYTKAALLLDGRRVGSGQARFHRKGAVRVKDLILQGRSESTLEGAALRLSSVGDASNGGSVQWVDFAGINIIDFADGVHFDCYEGNASLVSFINGNTFRGFFFQNCKNFWRFTCAGAGGGADGDISLNSVVGTVYQVSTRTEKLILVEGNSSGFCSSNTFLSMECFDWDAAPAASAIAVDLGLGTGWLFAGVGSLKAHQFLMRGSNQILGETIKTHQGSTVPADADKWLHGLQNWIGNTNGNRAGLILSDGKNWRPVAGMGGDRVNYTARQVALEPLDTISRQMFAQNAAESAGIPTVFGLTRAACGSEVHIQRRAGGGSEQVYIFSPNTAFTSRFYDPFAGTDSGAGLLLRIDAQFAEVILRVLENANVAILFKKGTVSYQSVNQGQKTFNPASIAAGGTEVTTVTVTGALTGDKAAYAFFTQDTLGVTISAAVTATDTITVTFTNPTAAAVDVPSGVLYALSIA
jgi:hypothetical protein